MGSTNRETYNTLISYQPLILHRPYVKIHAFSAHLASRLVPDFATAPRFARRRNTVSTRSVMISLNAASSAGIPFICITAVAISGDGSGLCDPQSVLRKPRQFIRSTKYLVRR